MNICRKHIHDVCMIIKTLFLFQFLDHNIWTDWKEPWSMNICKSKLNKYVFWPRRNSSVFSLNVFLFQSFWTKLNTEDQHKSSFLFSIWILNMTSFFTSDIKEVSKLKPQAGIVFKLKCPIFRELLIHWRWKHSLTQKIHEPGLILPIDGQKCAWWANRSFVISPARILLQGGNGHDTERHPK